jgi:hypothetical protein
MSFWIALSAPFAAPAGVDPHRYQRVATAVASHVADRVTLCYAGSAWLKRRFPARSYVQVHLLAHNDASVSVHYLKTKSWGDPDGPQEIQCGLRIPTSWFAEAGDGLAGLRLFQATLHAVNAVGDHYDIGRPAAAAAKPGRGDLSLWDPFRPLEPGPSAYADIDAHLERLAASINPDQLLLAVKEPTSPTVTRQCRSMGAALGAIADQHALTSPKAEATAWTIQIPS